MKQIEWSEPALLDMAALDKGVADRVRRAVERFAETAAGNESSRASIRRSTASALAIGACALGSIAKSSAFSASGIAGRLIGETPRFRCDALVTLSQPVLL